VKRDARRGGPGPAAYVVSAAIHAALAALAFIAFRSPPAVTLPPMYHVELIAAPPGERAIGEVKETPPSTATPVTAPRPSDATVKTMPNPKKTADNPVRRATPDLDVPKTKVKSNAPKAGGGPIGGKGTDVANVLTQGIEFPFPGYLNNIVRQIALNFKPRNPNSKLRAEVTFLIHRDGSVSDLKFVKRSGNYAFDLEAQSAVEAAARARSFGPLPGGFRDDVLPVFFSFDPDFIR
jgi:periplasmic protein TonB